MADDIYKLYLRRLDKYLVPRTNKLIVFGLLTILFSFYIRSFSDLLVFLSWAAIIEWLYISIRKYGWLDTIMFFTILPYLLIEATLSAVSKSSPTITKPDIQEFATEVSDALLRSINEVYDGKIVDTSITKDEVYITVETPYGIRIPVQKILAVVAKQLHISVVNIVYEEVSQRRSSYTLTKMAIDEYEAYKMRTRLKKSFSEIWERVLCKSKKHF